MTTEEKATAYDEAIERAKEELKTCNSQGCFVARLVVKLFPELKESEDNRISREITEFILTHRIDEPNDIEDTNSWLVWLEKQGEKPQGKSALEAAHEEKVDNANKVEPKFKIGDWVVCEATGLIYQIEQCIENLSNHKYGYDLIGGRYVGSDEAEFYHLWTIQDAKEGDILVASDGSLFIFAKVEDNSAYHHFSLCKNGSKEIGDGNHAWENSSFVHPATKEQRNLLFQKMRETGYEWNDEKKELKKIEDEEYNGEDYGINGLWHAMNILERTLGKVSGYQTDDGILSHQCAITAVKKLYYKQKPVWSEEDEHRIKDTIYFLDTAKKHYASTVELDACINWLELLKQRIGG